MDTEAALILRRYERMLTEIAGEASDSSLRLPFEEENEKIITQVRWAINHYSEMMSEILGCYTENPQTVQQRLLAFRHRRFQSIADPKP